MIKYIGSKRRLVPTLGEMLSASEASTTLDLFTGTTRVAQEFKRRGARVTAVDTARYSEVFAQCHIATDASTIDKDDLREALDELNALKGEAGYFTETFCVRSRFFQPFNGERVDVIRDRIQADFGSSPLYPILLTSLIDAADRVDSTTGLQMAYVKEWAPRSYKPLELRSPELFIGPGQAVRGDATQLVGTLGSFDLAYLDPPYNQHSYRGNYHVWETLVAWDAPEHYGVACKRVDIRDPSTKSVFNQKRQMPTALCNVIQQLDARVVIISYNDESWVTLEDLVEWAGVHGYVQALAFDSKRYVGAQIGIYNPNGERVGEVNRLRNLEYVIVAGPEADVRRITAPYVDANTPGAEPRSPSQQSLFA